MTTQVIEAMHIEQVPLDKIRPNLWQPRTTLDQGKYEETRESVRKNGLFQFPSGRRLGVDGMVELADGHLRYQIFQDLQREEGEKWAVLPVIIRDMTDQQMADAIVESNEKRQGLNAVDLARFLRRYLDEFGVTQEQLAAKFSMSQPAVANTLRLLDLPEKVQTMIISHEITATHGRELLRAKHDPAMQERLAEESIKYRMTVDHLASSVDAALRQEGRPLYKQGWPAPEFDLKACNGCESRTMINAWDRGREEERPFCVKASCWEKKQKTAVDRKNEEMRKKVQAQAAGKKVLDLDRLSFDKQTDISSSDAFTKDCDGCQHQALGKYSHQKVAHKVCLNPSCYRKKKAKVTREENARMNESYQQLLTKLQEKTDVSQPFDRETCLLILEAYNGHDEEKALARLMGMEAKGWQWRGKPLEDKLREQPVETLRWFIVFVAAQRRFAPGVYHSDRSKQFESFLSGGDWRRQDRMLPTSADLEGLDDEDESSASDEAAAAPAEEETPRFHPPDFVDDSQVCQMCHWSSGCEGCCRDCKNSCGGQKCGLPDSQPVRLSRWKAWQPLPKPELRKPQEEEQPIE